MAESVECSYYNQEESELMKPSINDRELEASEQAELNASRAKISLQLHETGAS